jgi:predicted PurR-regulated permease PerM
MKRRWLAIPTVVIVVSVLVGLAIPVASAQGFDDPRTLLQILQDIYQVTSQIMGHFNLQVPSLPPMPDTPSFVNMVNWLREIAVTIQYALEAVLNAIVSGGTAGTNLLW